MTLAPEFKFSRLTSIKNSKRVQGLRRAADEVELFKHDLLTSLHAIRLGVSQVKSGKYNKELITAMEDELAHLMSVTEGNFFDDKVFLAKDLVASIKKFFLFSYPEDKWRGAFDFFVEEIAEKKVRVCNLKQIFRNLCANLRENGNQAIRVEFKCGCSFHVRILSHRGTLSEADHFNGEGKGIRSIRKLLKHSNGVFYFDILDDCVVQEIVLPIFQD